MNKDDNKLNIKELLDRVVGDTSWHGETYHDKEANDKLNNEVSEVLEWALDRVFEDLHCGNGYEYSCKILRKTANTLIKNLILERLADEEEMLKEYDYVKERKEND